MAATLNEIEWSEPLLPYVQDPEFDKTVKSTLGMVTEVYHRVASNHWLREVCLLSDSYKVRHVPSRMFFLGGMITAQENACRYCYGALRALLRLQGYQESFITRLESDLKMAELDEKESAFTQFCRNLARSNPRPSKKDRDQLIQMGYSPLVVNEMAVCIAIACFYNRVCTLIACPPEQKLERLAGSFFGGVLSKIAGRLIRHMFISKRVDKKGDTNAPKIGAHPFAPLIRELEGVPSAGIIEQMLAGALAPGVIPVKTKALMFLVVARQLNCKFCTAGSEQLLKEQGLTAAEIKEAVESLGGKGLDPSLSSILDWTRDTVRYHPIKIQKKTEGLLEKIGPDALLEIVGTAAVANSTVRLAMLIQ